MICKQPAKPSPTVSAITIPNWPARIQPSEPPTEVLSTIKAFMPVIQKNYGLPSAL